MSEIQRAWCDCCRRPVDVVSTSGLCIACYLALLLVENITAETDMSRWGALRLSKALIVPMFNALIQRLQVPGQEHPLALELLQSIAALKPPN
jgi:hypothetical protein